MYGIWGWVRVLTNINNTSKLAGGQYILHPLCVFFVTWNKIAIWERTMHGATTDIIN